MNRSWVRCNECFHSGEMRWQGSMTSGLGEVGWSCFSTTGWREEIPRGRMNEQTDKNKDGWEDGIREIHSYLFFECLPPFRGTFKAVLPMYIFFMVCLCPFPRMCLYGLTTGSRHMCYFPKGDQLSLACRVTECSACADPAKQSKHTGWQLLATTVQPAILREGQSWY